MAVHPRAPLRAGAVLAAVVAAAVLQWRLFAGPAPPPLDFGSGSMFDLIAPRYDAINRVLAVGLDTGWRRRMVRRVCDGVAHRGPEVRILDVATGTADVAILLAQEIPNASVVGVDPSRQMLQVGRRKLEGLGLAARVRLHEEDAQNFAGLEPESFDAATMAFGIRNVPDRRQALCQIHRVLKDDGPFCILEFSEPDESFGTMGLIATFFIRHVIPFVGGILSGAPREYWHLQNSIKNFPSPTEFGKIIKGTKCDSGSFELLDIVQMNFGSVQLYDMRIRKEQAITSQTCGGCSQQ